MNPTRKKHIYPPIQASIRITFTMMLPCASWAFTTNEIEELRVCRQCLGESPKFVRISLIQEVLTLVGLLVR